MARRDPDRDSYGTTREEAENRLGEFLRTTLGEPQAELVDVHLESGRWQSRVRRSQRGITVVFLQEHQAQLVPGHMTTDAHATPEDLKNVPEP